jgi:hypothetical protein
VPSHRSVRRCPKRAHRRPFASISVGSRGTRATNHDCSRNSRQAKGLRTVNTAVSRDIAQNPPTARSGLAMTAGEATMLPLQPIACAPHALTECPRPLGGTALRPWVVGPRLCPAIEHHCAASHLRSPNACCATPLHRSLRTLAARRVSRAELRPFGRSRSWATTIFGCRGLPPTMAWCRRRGRASAWQNAQWPQRRSTTLSAKPCRRGGEVATQK